MLDSVVVLAVNMLTSENTLRALQYSTHKNVAQGILETECSLEICHAVDVFSSNQSTVHIDLLSFDWY